jgi:hypothetical protein
MANTNITGLRFTRLRAAHGFTGHALFALTSMLHDLCCEVHTTLINGLAQGRIAPITGLAQGRIVSISRGSPPPKKR